MPSPTDKTSKEDRSSKRHEAKKDIKILDPPDPPLAGTGFRAGGAHREHHRLSFCLPERNFRDPLEGQVFRKGAVFRVCGLTGVCSSFRRPGDAPPERPAAKRAGCPGAF